MRKVKKVNKDHEDEWQTFVTTTIEPFHSSLKKEIYLFLFKINADQKSLLETACETVYSLNFLDWNSRHFPEKLIHDMLLQANAHEKYHEKTSFEAALFFGFEDIAKSIF